MQDHSNPIVNCNIAVNHRYEGNMPNFVVSAMPTKTCFLFIFS